MFVLDASTTLAWAFRDESNSNAQWIRQRLLDDLPIVPSLWLIEVANVLLVAERRQRLTRGQIATFIEFLRGLPIQVDDSGLEYIFDRGMFFARSFGLSVCDTMYLDLALRLGIPLATQDKRLSAAARLAGVRLLEASDA